MHTPKHIFQSDDVCLLAGSVRTLQQRTNKHGGTHLIAQLQHTLFYFGYNVARFSKIVNLTCSVVHRTLGLDENATKHLPFRKCAWQAIGTLERTRTRTMTITTVVYEDAVHYCNNIDVRKAYVVLVIRVQLLLDAIFTSIHII